MNTALQQAVLDRLDAQARERQSERDAAGKSAAKPRGRTSKKKEADDAAQDWPYLVIAALDSASALEEQLKADAKSDLSKNDKRSIEKQAGATAKKKSDPPGAYLRSITVEGFRGVGKKVALELPPGPGLTLVIGRNGSGKSSFAEALELLLTGETYRWVNRAKIWKDGWRNLHHPHAAIQAEFSLDGEPQPAQLAADWKDGDGLDTVRRTTQIRGKERRDASSLGWDDALKSYRPCLSYNELGSMLDEGPSKLYDGLASILGLEDLTDAQARLRDARLARERTQKTAIEGLMRHVPALRDAASSDDRAREIITAVSTDDWDLDKIERILAGSTSANPDTDTERVTLQRIAQLSVPNEGEIERTTARLRQADDKRRAAEGTVAKRALLLAELLDKTLAFHDAYGDGKCPVCDKDGALTPSWHKKKEQEARAFREAATAATSANTEADAARRATQALPAPTSPTLDRAHELGLKAADDAKKALAAWQQALTTADLSALATAIDKAAMPLRTATTALRDQATQELAKREDRWRPLQMQLAAWMTTARDAQRAARLVPSLKTAETWLRDTAGDLRDERFAPIALRAQEICDDLLRGSNVKVAQIHLTGAAAQRRVDLDVTVDGVPSAALGVMSQGELNALALSLFIPRATLPESPFRFIVIDDPVQSMDPARVDGLARVLQKAAATRQVVVFTHDDRLAETVRRLAIPATVMEVRRREASAVEVRRASDPMRRYLDDAFQVSKTQGLPDKAAARVIPGLLRMAVEAACMEAVRRRRLGRGENHGEVEELLEKASHRLTMLAALTLFDDMEKGGDVLPALDKKGFATTFKTLNAGAHGVGGPVPTIDLARSAENLADYLWRRT